VADRFYYLTSIGQDLSVHRHQFSMNCHPSSKYWLSFRPVLVGGDINIHVEDTADVDARRLHELLTSFDITQHVNSPTHRLGGTLDLVMTFTDYQLAELCVDPPGIISDHSLVRCRLPIVADPAPSTARLVRAWRQVDRDTLRRALETKCAMSTYRLTPTLTFCSTHTTTSCATSLIV